jgi:hypothetical protein
MRREVRRLKAKAIESLTLSIELFNRPRDAGRIEAVLLHADHAEIKCVSPEQAITLQALNGWRDAAQRYLLELSEPELYVAAQGAVTLF